MTEMSGLDREDSPHGNATDKIPWYGVYYGLELKKGWGSNLDVVVLTGTDNQRLSGQISSAVSGFWRIRGGLPSGSLSKDPTRDKTHEAQTGNDKSDGYGSRT
jgi:hypothetical protein